jgi:hypothetical protein
VDGGIDAFRAGRGFKIIELNGVTSEATHIYHPGTPLAEAYRVLTRQWQIAFAIGAENRLRGVAPTSVWTILRLARDYARTSKRHLREDVSGSPGVSAHLGACVPIQAEAVDHSKGGDDRNHPKGEVKVRDGRCRRWPAAQPCS